MEVIATPTSSSFLKARWTREVSSEHDRSVSDSPPALVPESRGSVGFGAKPQLFHCSPGRPPPGHCCARFPDGQTLSPPIQGHRDKKGVWEQPQAPSSPELIDESLHSVLSGCPPACAPAPSRANPPPIRAHPRHQASRLHSTSVQGTLTSPGAARRSAGQGGVPAFLPRHGEKSWTEREEPQL